jgi:signal transduction histidine kinase
MHLHHKIAYPVKRNLLLTGYLFINSLALLAQVEKQFSQKAYNEDSLTVVLNKTPEDTSRVHTLIRLAGSYYFKQPEISYQYSEQILTLSRKLNYSWGIANGLFRGAESKRMLADYIGALKLHFQLLEFNQSLHEPFIEVIARGGIGINYFELQDYQQAISYLRKAVWILDSGNPEPIEILFNVNLANAFIETNLTDSAFYYLTKAGRRIQVTSPQLGILKLIGWGDYYLKVNNNDSAAFYYKKAFILAHKNMDNAVHHFCLVSDKLATLFELQNKLDSSFYFAHYSNHVAREKKLNKRILESSRLLSRYHRKNSNLDSAFFYEDIAIKMNDSIFGQKKFSQLQLLVLQEQQRSQSLQQEEERKKSQIIVLSLLTISFVILVAGLGLYRSNRSKQKSNLQLQKTLCDLRQTQSQLIQSEKMASLGELTAGIAHEIQNPLNFVNNFSEVNAELIDELEREAYQGNLNEIRLIAKDIKENESKINHHGKRADAIVKGMLQHSRTSSGQKELTDINVLCDEYLRLSYHGLRAKDKSFNAKFETDYDGTLPKIDVVPQDIGRVVLNLINNAFYAVSEKSKAIAQDATGFQNRSGLPAYEPSVKVRTHKSGDNLLISVQDNGYGIPDSIKEKIFQPFFTTKPTGHGTGLGLSLSYDIVKAHGGELRVDSTENVGTTFTILLNLK